VDKVSLRELPVTWVAMARRLLYRSIVERSLRGRAFLRRPTGVPEHSMGFIDDAH
jgi:hypothetical protein